MKILIAIVLAASVSFGAAYVIISARHEASLNAERARFEDERARLDAALAEAERKPARIETISIPSSAPAPVVLQPTPEEILERLLKLKPGSGASRTYTIRQVVHNLASLTETGQRALPVIRAFLATNQDVDYAIEEEGRGGDGPGGRGDFWSWRRGQQLRTDFVLPPSLRMGLMDVLRDIGGDEAEQILAETLSTTGRGVEVAYLARVLEEMAPGKYRDLAVTAAIDLLTHPPAIDHPNRLDEMAKSYLYGVLGMFNDTSFVGIAQQLLVSPDGRIDRTVLDYLNNTLKEQAVPALYQAYKDGRITNMWDRASLAGQVLNYAGQNQQANALLSEIVTDTNLDSRMRAFTIVRLAGGNFGPFGGEAPTDPNVIRARMQVVESLKTTAQDERIVQSLDLTSRNLQNLLEGKPVESPFSGRGRGQRGGGGPPDGLPSFFQ
jgi:hypothetical protein